MKILKRWLGRSKTPDRVLIVSTGKSGSTALFFRLKKSLGPETVGLFEPEAITPALLDDAAQHPVVCKVILPVEGDVLEQLGNLFSKRILLVRDPRDVLVSALLYLSGYHFAWKRSESAIRDAVRLVERKESHPDEYSVLGLLEALWDDFDRKRFAEQLDTLTSQVIDIADGPHPYFVYKYEDLIAGNLAALEKFLGIPVVADDSIDPRFRRVVRTKQAESWRDWLLEEDERYLRPLFADFMRRFHYPLDDWTPRAKRVILPEHGSRYFIKVINERRVGHKLAAVQCS